ncbi:hypothetical protein quinque_002319 [Culex quinquefasciatus]
MLLIHELYVSYNNPNLKICVLLIVSLEADKPLEQQTERKVTIVGTPEAQWKAQYLMRENGFVSGTADVRFTVEILVPSAQVGRIIGKGGQNVRDLQRVTGSIIKQPEHTAAMHVHTLHVEKITACIQIASKARRELQQEFVLIMAFYLFAATATEDLKERRRTLATAT